MNPAAEAALIAAAPVLAELVAMILKATIGAKPDSAAVKASLEAAHAATGAALDAIDAAHKAAREAAEAELGRP